MFDERLVLLFRENLNILIVFKERGCRTAHWFVFTKIYISKTKTEFLRIPFSKDTVTSNIILLSRDPLQKNEDKYANMSR